MLPRHPKTPNKTYLKIALLGAFCLSLFGVSAYPQTVVSAGEGLIAEYDRIRNLLDSADRSDGVYDHVQGAVDKLFDLNRLAPQLLPEKWRGMSAYQRERFIRAFEASLTNRVRDHVRNGGRLPKLTFESKDEKARFITLRYRYPRGNGHGKLNVNMLKYPDGTWKIVNINTDRWNLRQYYYEICHDVLDDYSVNYLIAEISNSDYVVLEDFEASEVGKLPKDWTWKSSDDDKHKPYEIKVEDGNKYLAARDNGESVIIGKEVRWNLKKYPYISFRWRVFEIPEGGDERYGPTNDSGAAIYITYKKKLGLIPETVKYLWSTTLPVGTATQRNGVGRPWNVVVASGEKNLGKWQTFTFNAFAAYKKTFGGDPPNAPIGIGILSDANSTNSKAYADYDDIRALKSANADSGIEQFMKGGD